MYTLSNEISGGSTPTSDRGFSKTINQNSQFSAKTIISENFGNDHRSFLHRSVPTVSARYLRPETKTVQIVATSHQVLPRSFSYCTAVLRASVRKFCSAVHFCRFFCDPFVPRRSKKERLRSVSRSTLTACSAELNRFGLRFVRAHLTGVCLRSTLTVCSAEVNRFGL